MQVLDDGRASLHFLAELIHQEVLNLPLELLCFRKLEHHLPCYLETLEGYRLLAADCFNSIDRILYLIDLQLLFPELLLVRDVSQLTV